MVREADAPPAVCPDCGTDLDGNLPEGSLCPRCLLELAFESPSLRAEVEDQGEAPTLVQTEGMFSEGQILGDRYRVRTLLGRGGMGEVWRAFDLKLRVDVALKALHHHLLSDERALETLRQEVRIARQVVSANVCRVYDLVELDGQELVSMEYVDGITLLDILRARAPLELTEAREIAAQFLAGLEAIHEEGLVHRDVKPENLMMTRAGRIVVMDFGIAKGLADVAAGTVSGTPAYMAPEQARGEALTASADVFAAGIVLAEMIDPGGLATPEARQAIWRAVREIPPRIAESPWQAVLRRALATLADDRYAGAAALARALEEVTLRVEGEEGVSPYPGLASFSREDAEYFFGRELEVEEMWKKLQRPHLLGLIGPSGAGKSSFLQAGLMPVIPTGWRMVLTAPGRQPFAALGQALVPELAGDTDVMKEFVRFEEPDVAVALATRWRQRHDNVLLVVDQFEELFTQSPPEVQGRFAGLLGRLAVEANVRVLLSMRDDFLFHCSAQPALAPMFSELTPLRPPTGSALRRALVQPALKCGYRFEDDALVDEMVAEVSDERGALPMLAFAAARLWEHRDREQGLLTREAYEHIGGVGGALAQHAEQTLERIGADRIPVVRELFRNLVTAQGTRAARRREELVSVFPQDGREAAEGTVDALIDARLLTSYEEPVEDDEQDEHQRVEIIHESLLGNWPRLVRWQARDADSARMRDQLRQAARIWEERGRPEDLLWTGTAFKEYAVWREHYEGGLTPEEEAFGSAMARRAARGRRRRRIAVTLIVVLALGIAAVTSALWQRSESARQQAEASKLLALGRLEFESNPTAALAYAMRSLELADAPAARRFALETLWQGPTAFVVSEDFTWRALFSPDGRWLTAGGYRERLELWPRRGGEPLRLPGEVRLHPVGFTDDSRYLITHQKRDEDSLRVWSVANGELVSMHLLGEVAETGAYLRSDRGTVLTYSIPPEWDGVEWTEWPIPSGEPRDAGTDASVGYWVVDCRDTAGRWLGWGDQHEVQAIPFSRPSLEKAVRIGKHEAVFTGCALDSNLGRIASIDEEGHVRLWSLDPPAPEPVRSLEVGEPVGARSMAFTPDGRWLAAGGSDQITRLWDLQGPPDAAPWRLRRGKIDHIVYLSFDPQSAWLVSSESAGTVIWPVGGQRSYRLAGHSGGVSALEFTPDSAWLVSASFDRTLRRWPLAPAVAEQGEVAGVHGASLERVAIDPSGARMAWSGSGDGPYVSGASGGLVQLMGMKFMPFALAWDESGRWVVSAGGVSEPDDAKLFLWDLEGGDIRECANWRGNCLEPSIVLDAGDAAYVTSARFLEQGVLLSAGAAGLRRWSIEAATYEQLVDEPVTGLILLPGKRSALLRVGARDAAEKRIVLFDLVEASERDLDLSRFGEQATTCAVDPTGEILACGDREGIVRVGRWAGGDVHWLLGHTGSIQSLAISPDGRWIATGSADRDIRIWPMPDVDTPPLHGLPLDELLAKLGSLTNLRVIENAESETGWSLEIGPFAGWEDVPVW